MRKALGLGLSVLTLCALQGCGGNPYGSAMKKIYKDLDELARAYTSVRREEQLSAALTKIRAAKQSLDKDVARLVALRPRSQDEKARLDKVYGGPLANLVNQVLTAESRIAAFKTGGEAVQENKLPEQLLKLVQKDD